MNKISGLQHKTIMLEKPEEHQLIQHQTRFCYVSTKQKGNKKAYCKRENEKFLTDKMGNKRRMTEKESKDLQFEQLTLAKDKNAQNEQEGKVTLA